MRRFRLLVSVNYALPLVLLESHLLLLSEVNDFSVDEVIDLVDGHAFELRGSDPV